MDQARLLSIVVSAWDRATTLLDVQQCLSMLDDVFAEFLESQGDVTLSLNPIPSQLVRQMDIDSDDPLAMLLDLRSVWLPYFWPVLMQHSQRV